MNQVNPKLIIAAIIGLAVVAALSTMVYTIPAESAGVVTRFGKLKNDDVRPGLHFKLPFGIDQVAKVPVERQLKQEFGFGTVGATNRSQFSSSQRSRQDERSMITGDRNEVSVEWIIQYRIHNPSAFLFRVREPELTLRDVSESVMREVVGDRTVDEVLTVGRQEIEAESEAKMQAVADVYDLGLQIDQVQLNDVNPPTPVQKSFNEVNQAQQERERAINVARGEYNKEVPRQRGVADQEISQAEGYATQRVNEAMGDADRFRAVFEEYRKAPEVTKRRLYLETLAEVVPKLGNKIIMDEGAQQVLPMLQLPAAAAASKR